MFYRLATPQIAIDPSSVWNAWLLDSFYQRHVYAIAELALAAAQQVVATKTLRVFHPTTTFPNKLETHFTKYTATAESLLLHVTRSIGTDVRKQSLPRLKTDQNSSFLSLENVDSPPQMLKLLQSVRYVDLQMRAETRGFK